MPVPRLYDADEVRAAMRVGAGLGRAQSSPDPDDRLMEHAIDDAMALYADAHGTPAPNYPLFKELHERREWRALAEAHLAAAHQSQSEAGPHGLVALASIGLALVGELADVGRTIDALDTALRTRS